MMTRETYGIYVVVTHYYSLIADAEDGRCICSGLSPPHVRVVKVVEEIEELHVGLHPPALRVDIYPSPSFYGS